MRQWWPWPLLARTTLPPSLRIAVGRSPSPLRTRVHRRVAALPIRLLLREFFRARSYNSLTHPRKVDSSSNPCKTLRVLLSPCSSSTSSLWSIARSAALFSMLCHSQCCFVFYALELGVLLTSSISIAVRGERLNQLSLCSTVVSSF